MFEIHKIVVYLILYLKFRSWRVPPGLVMVYDSKIAK